VGTVVYGDQFLMTTMLSTGQGNPVIASLMMVWFVISTGSLSMMFPAIIDGHSVLGSVTLSFRMSYRYFDRVFGFWIALLLVDFVIILPTLVLPLLFGTGVMTAGSMMTAIYAVPMGLFLAFVGLPAVTIGLTRIYMILTAEDDIPGEEGEEGGVSMIGGF
ncbi:MAG: hypothetical protein ACP6KW_12270, partial [Candidatus Thorarchaeota archaeon]